VQRFAQSLMQSHVRHAEPRAACRRVDVQMSIRADVRTGVYIDVRIGVRVGG